MMWPGFVIYGIYLHYKSSIEKILVWFSFINNWSSGYFICPLSYLYFFRYSLWRCVIIGLIERIKRKNSQFTFSHFNNRNVNKTQLPFNCSKSTIEALEKGVKCVPGWHQNEVEQINACWVVFVIVWLMLICYRKLLSRSNIWQMAVV